MNKIVLIGRTTKEIELKKTSTGKSIVSFNLAVNRRYKREGGTDTDFIQCIAWSGTAETIAKYVKKGHRIAVEGSLETSEYEKDGKKLKSYAVIVEQFDFLEKKTDTSTDTNDSEGDVVPDPSEIPF